MIIILFALSYVNSGVRLNVETLFSCNRMGLAVAAFGAGWWGMMTTDDELAVEVAHGEAVEDARRTCWKSHGCHTTCYPRILLTEQAEEYFEYSRNRATKDGRTATVSHRTKQKFCYKIENTTRSKEGW